VTIATGEGKGDGEGKREGSGEGRGDGNCEGDGKGSPTRLPFRANSGLRRDRIVEETDGGADGVIEGLFFASSRLGNTPSGAPGRGRMSWPCTRVFERALLVKTNEEISETTTKRLREDRRATRDLAP
jgi:hypothetical protein